MTEPTQTDDPRVAVLRLIQDSLDRQARAGVELRRLRERAIARCRHVDGDLPAMTWAEVGEVLGVTAQRAEQLSRPERNDR